MQGPSPLFVAGRRFVDGMAMLAAVELVSVLPLQVIARCIPSFQVPGAKLSLGVLFVASALKRKACLDLGSSRSRGLGSRCVSHGSVHSSSSGKPEQNGKFRIQVPTGPGSETGFPVQSIVPAWGVRLARPPWQPGSPARHPVWTPNANWNNTIHVKKRKAPKQHLHPVQLRGPYGLRDEVRGQAQRFECSSIGPPAFENAVAEQAFFQVTVVEIGDFQLSPA